MNERTVLVSPDAVAEAVPAAFGLYAWVFSHDQKSDLDRQVARLAGWAAEAGGTVVRVEAEVGSGMNGSRAKMRRLLADPRVTTVVVEHRDRVGADEHRTGRVRAFRARRRLVVLDDGEVDDDLVRDMAEVLTSLRSALWSPQCSEQGVEGGGLRAARHRPEGCCQRSGG